MSRLSSREWASIIKQICLNRTNLFYIFAFHITSEFSMKLITTILIFVAVTLFYNEGYSTVYYACGTGISWNGSTSFVYTASDCSGTAVNPNTLTVADELVIQAGAVIIVTGNQTLDAIKLTVIGTLFMKSGGTPGKLTMPDNSATLVLEVGSMLGCSSNGVTSTTCSPANSTQVIIGSGGSKWTYKGSDLDDVNASPKPSTLDNTGGPLPIELIYFSGKTVHKTVELKWATASEENFDYFSIERSFDGKKFIEIAQVKGNGSSYQRLDYSYTDNFPGVGVSYYRLYSIDFDGYTEVFDYVIVNVEGINHDATVFPIPATSGVVNIQINFDLKENAQVLFYNSMGHVDLSLSITDWLSPVDVSSLRTGNYIVNIITKEGVFSKRILVR